MMLLLGFDLPTTTPEARRQAVAYRKRLVALGFSMKQYSLYEREVQSETTRKNVIRALKETLPDAGAITLYSLPDHVNNAQLTILGKDAPKKCSGKPRLIVI